MPQILRTTLLQDSPLVAGGFVQTDLPVNPISFILVTIKALNNTPANADYAQWNNLMDIVERVSVTYRGASIMAGRAIDLAVMYALQGYWTPRQLVASRVDNSIRAITFPLLFGRKPYGLAEAFPATRRGDLTLRLTAPAVLPAMLDNITIQAETVELLDAQPSSFLKVTETQRTMQLGDQNEISLPLSNRVLGLLLQAFTFPLAGVFSASFSSVALELDNVEVVYSRANWETLQGEFYRCLPGGWPYHDHIHQENVAAAYAQFADTRGMLPIDDEIHRYAYMDLDPLHDGSYAIDTANAADFTLQVNSDVTDASPSRVLIAEHVVIGPGGSSPAA